MKKLALTIAIVLGISLGSFAQYGGGLFKYGAMSDEEYYGAGFQGKDGSPLLPGLPNFGAVDDQPAPLGSGTLLLIGFGAAYAMKKRIKK